MDDTRSGIYIRKSNEKFLVEHRYLPTPDLEQPTTFDDVVKYTIGQADTLEDAERIKREYANKIDLEAANDGDEDKG